MGGRKRACRKARPISRALLEGLCTRPSLVAATDTNRTCSGCGVWWSKTRVHHAVPSLLMPSLVTRMGVAASVCGTSPAILDVTSRMSTWQAAAAASAASAISSATVLRDPQDPTCTVVSSAGLLEQLGLEGTQGTHNGVYAAARPHVERRVTIGACVGQQPSHAEADRRGRGCVLNVLFTPMSAAPGHRRGTATQRSSTDSLNHRRARTRRTRQFAKCTRCVVGRAVIDVPSV